MTRLKCERTEVRQRRNRPGSLEILFFIASNHLLVVLSPPSCYVTAPCGDGVSVGAVPGSEQPAGLGTRALQLCGLEDIQVEERLHVQLPPWTCQERVTLNMELGPGARRDAPDCLRRETAEAHLRTSTSRRPTWIWSDGSAEGGVTCGGGGAMVILKSGERREVRVAAGSLCSSTRAELFAMRAALEEVSELTGDLATGPVVLCTDSQAALALIANGAGIQTTPLGAAIWRLLSHLTARDQDVTLQWVPAHCGLPGNERADELAKEASSLPQEAPIDVRTVTKAVSRAAYRAWRHQWPNGLFKQIWGDRMPSPVLGEDRGAAVDTHQLRAGHWSRSRQYLHRIGCLPSPDCAGCPDKECPVGFCIVCGEEADTPEHVMLRVPVPGRSSPERVRHHLH